MVKKKLPGNIYRCKGVVYTTEHPDRRVILQAVGRRSDISLEDEWGEQAPRDANELTRRFDACVVEPKRV